jgi:RsiW-degrading membrane proteinase PrsW (M82 family)
MTRATIFIAPDSVLSLRGRPEWTILFWIVGGVVPFCFGYAVYLYSIDNAPSRGFGGGIALASCFILLHFVHSFLSKQSSTISLSLAVQFFLRGAFLSIFIAMVIEATGLSELHPKYVELRDLPIALIVGVSEEFAKFLSLLVGLCLVPSDLPPSLAYLGEQGCPSCLRWWSVLVDTPLGLAMAGIATGIGFMTTENIEYFFLIFSSLDTQSCVFTALLRICFNLHPLLTGLAAARLATAVFPPPHTRTLTLGKLFRAIWPSVLLHALFDFGLMFASDNPDEQPTDTVLIITSIALIPVSGFLLVKTYRSLCKASSLSTPLQPVLV